MESNSKNEREPPVVVVAHAREPFALPAPFSTCIYDALHTFIIHALPSDCIIDLVDGHDWHTAAVFYLGSSPGSDSVCLRLSLLASTADHHDHLTCTRHLHPGSNLHAQSSGKVDYGACPSTSDGFTNFPRQNKGLKSNKVHYKVDNDNKKALYNVDVDNENDDDDNATQRNSMTRMSGEEARLQFLEGLEMFKAILEQGYKWGSIMSGCISIEYYAGSNNKIEDVDILIIS
ncbi:hypothetical protein GOP47_0001574 [Adiantum capillus-veneris]|uniref:Uncharacterized protein n=1 Tax=Adiantum capillus-veneris TaxID=13818 RepID=A0A9D4V9T1_ADICA|nr:hypothetical protein GOP47_0001574 [Adiantum capillus-veneris]